MHDDLWAGVGRKYGNASFHLAKLQATLDHRQTTQMDVVLLSSGAVLANLWQEPFYAHLDAFISTTRSVAEVIKCCFGHDASSRMKGWFASLTFDEQVRRKAFSGTFQDKYDDFIRLPLSEARNISEHRTGYADVTVAINGMYGIIYIGGPIMPIPNAESQKIDDPDRAFLRPRFHELQPTQDDFTIDGKNLFEECGGYLEAAGALMEAARRIAEKVHSDKPLTPPLGSPHPAP